MSSNKPMDIPSSGRPVKGVRLDGPAVKGIPVKQEYGYGASGARRVVDETSWDGRFLLG